MKKESLNDIETKSINEINFTDPGTRVYNKKTKKFGRVKTILGGDESLVIKLDDGHTTKINLGNEEQVRDWKQVKESSMIKLKSLIKETSEFRSQSVDKYKQPREELLATNESSYHWEYDTMIYYAILFVNVNTEELRLVITHTHIKSGLGKGEQTEKVFQLLVGTVSAPNKGAIRQALTKYGYKRSRSETPYGLWYPGQGLQPQKLDSILANYR